MKKLLTLALAFVMVFALAACGDNTDPAPSGNGTTDPGTSQQEPSDTPDDSSTTEPETSQPSVSGEIYDFAVGTDTVPAEWQKSIGDAGMNIKMAAEGPNYTTNYMTQFSNVSKEDYAKLIAYFDTLSYTEKKNDDLESEGMFASEYYCDWGLLDINYNANGSQITISWFAN